MSADAFQTEIDRLRRIIAELQHVRDAVLRPVAGNGGTPGAKAHYQAIVVRYDAYCRARGGHALLSMTRLMELAMACGDPMPLDPAIEALLRKTSPTRPPGAAPGDHRAA